MHPLQSDDRQPDSEPNKMGVRRRLDIVANHNSLGPPRSYSSTPTDRHFLLPSLVPRPTAQPPSPVNFASVLTDRRHPSPSLVPQRTAAARQLRSPSKIAAVSSLT
ncbi:hypothetical protein Tcan_08268 [Toxocara canis]|uniref:Uncharacterized protein n=1 Tax=Toxocara canis TaxID=6265 RepID=A0A0B2V4V2_TOXCA|nr:hypothetical protein Tcan_08268 [Toxocara canis]